MQKTLIFFTLISCFFSFSQVGIGTTTIDPSAVLEIVSTDSGVLFPKINLTGTDDTTTIANPQDGLIIYNTTSAGTGSTAITANSLYIFNGTSSSWERLNNEQKHEYGDFKYGMQSTDHKGWILLDGRLVSTLTPTEQIVAASLGFTTILPDLSDKVLKQKGVLGNTGGSNTTSFSIAQTNLPNVNFTGTTNSSGNHNHDINNMTLAGIDVVTGLTGLVGILSGIGVNLFGLSYYTNNTGSINTLSTGNHSHTATVNSGGSDTPVSNVDVENPYFSANAFIYLGY